MLANSHYIRQGPDYRFGEQQSFLDVRDTFGFAATRVGRWVSDAESAIAANLVFDSLADLAFIVNVPPITLGLRQSLNLDFGIGGRKGVQAHYAPGSRTLALAKNAGAGALAHEFWHALDHHLALVAFKSSAVIPAISFASELWLQELPLKSHPLNQALAALFRLVLLNADGSDASRYVSRAIALDKTQGVYYFSQPTELMARAFESAIEHCASVRNQYLVSGTRTGAAYARGVYPDDTDLPQIFEAMREYFSLLGHMLAQ
ncbi:CLCA_X family protein [Shewanella dokdonensis]|uniref:Large polyvalent protein-associated domain-containing protein n=1 Tax=Shewanella dokdonensis TaxID=712036 RepID=A0ABX8DJF1_9GAMM|nr:CLCA_X family protein [Shewanella dokdonensis]MCL1073097.1 hypothetical protein [Shewanella dokdonensis]QVK24934.1 hypothetical protein KHX94_18130 [Shewanella dokdonensis]